MIVIVSEQLKEFLDFVEESKRLYESSLDGMHQEEKRLQDFLHAIEFEESEDELHKLVLKLHESRVERRKCKDIVEEREEIVKFFQETQHKKTLDQLVQVLGKVRKAEKYHRDRTYIPRMKGE